MRFNRNHWMQANKFVMGVVIVSLLLGAWAVSGATQIFSQLP